MKRIPNEPLLALISSVCFLCASGLANADEIYVTSLLYPNSKILRVDSSGSVSTFRDVGFTAQGLAFDNNANLYVANIYGNTVEKFDASGHESTFVSTGLDNPSGLAFDSSGNLYVANNVSGVIQRITPSGQESVFVSGLHFPEGIVFDSSDNLYVANAGDKNVVKFTPDGSRSIFASGFNNPIGVAFNGNNLYVGDTVMNAVLKFNLSGQGSVFAQNLHDPIGLAFDSGGNLYVANEDSHEIVGFDPSLNPTLDVSSGSYFPLWVAVKPIPEPATWSLLALGVVVLLGGRRMRRERR